MNQPASKLPRSVVIAFAVLLVLAVLVTVMRQGASPDHRPAGVRSEAVAPIPVDASPRVELRATRREGTAYHSTVIGRIHGVMNQSTELAVYHPIFRGGIRSCWVAPWTLRASSEVLHNDGRLIRERRTFREVRSAELIAEPSLCDLRSPLEGSVSDAIVALAAKLRAMHPPDVQSAAMGALVHAQDPVYDEIARLTGIQPNARSSQRSAVSATARILDGFEGQTVEVALLEGRAEWSVPTNTPPQLVDALHRVGSLLDYRALPPPDLSAGESVTLSRLDLNEWLPPPLADDFLSDFNAMLGLELSAIEEADDAQERVLQCFEGSGRLDFNAANSVDGSAPPPLRVDHAHLCVDVTDPSNRYLRRLQFSLTLPPSILRSHTRFQEVDWDGDLVMDMVYLVDLRP